MRTHTNEFKQEIKKLGRQINGKIYVYSNYDLSSENNNNILTEDDIQIISEKFNKQEATEIDSNLIYSMNIIKNGNLLKSLMKEFDFEAKYDLNIGTAVNPHFGLLVNNSYEYLDYGDYIIYSKEYNLDSETWNYVCYDMMLYSMIKYTPIKDITYPTTIRNYISVIADKMGVEFANKEDEFVNYDQLVNEELFKDKGYTLRDILDKLSEVTASNIIINDNNELEIKYPEKNITEEKTVEGTNISILDNVGDTISDLQLQGNTYQQTYTGKNLLNPVPDVSSINGVTVSYNSATQEITLNGTCTTNNSVVAFGESSSSSIYRNNTFQLLANTTLYLRIKYISGTSTGQYLLAAYNNNFGTGLQAITTGTGQDVTNSKSWSYDTTFTKFRLRFENGTKFNNYKIKVYMSTTDNNFEPYVGRTASPNPDYPQAIQNVTGRQTIDVVGKNLYNETQFTWDTLSYKSIYVGTGTYTMSSPNMPIGNSNICNIFFLANKVSSGAASQNNGVDKETSRTVTSTDGYVTIAGRSTSPNNSYNPSDYDFQIEKSSTASSFEEYKGQSYEINLGKNLFDGELELGYYNDNGVKTNSNTNYRNKNIIAVNPNTTYTFSINGTSQKYVVYYYNESQAFINVEGLTTGTFTTPSNCYYMNFRCFNADFTSNYTNLKVQLEQGSQPTTYSEYFTPIELNKIGNYQDRIYKEKGTWYIEKKIGKVVLDGTETWTTVWNNTNRHGWRIDLTNALYPPSSNDYLEVLSDYYKSYTQNNLYRDTTYSNFVNYGLCIRANYSQLIIKNNDYTTVSSFKTWLSTHNTEVYYVLNTPTYTEITNTDLINQLESIELLNGINNIMVSSGDLAGGLKIKYVSEYETINEEYLKDINVAFGEQFGPINRVSIADSEDNYEYYAEDMTSISKNKKTQINIIDNEFVFNDDTQTICQAIFNKLNGLNYSLNDFSTTGVCYYDFLDIYNVQAKGNTYQCLLLNNEISINQGIEENIFTEEPENNEKSSNNYETSILSNKAVTFKINQQEKRLEQAVMEDNVIASLNLAIEDGQGIIEIKGNQVTIESDNFTLDADGSIEATAGEIGGYSIGTNQLSTQISKTYIFTQDDVNTVRNIILGNIQPTEEHIAKYDVNGNGCIEISDLAIIVSIVSGGGTKTFTGEISINNDDFNRVIKVTDSDGIKNSIGMLGSYFSYLGAKAIDLQNSSNQRCEIMPNEIYLVDYSGSSPSSTTITAQGILSPTITQTSLESAKKNFELLENALEIIKNIDIYKYQLKNEEDAAKKHIGFIIGNDYKYSEEVTSNENNGVDIYSFVSVCCKAIKEQQEIIDKMQQEIEFLKKESGK